METQSVTSWQAVVMFIVAAAIGALGQFLYKFGAEKATGGFSSYALNPWLIGGVFCYIAVMILFVAAFKFGGALSVLYPVYASTFIWAALISRYAFGTEVSSVNVVGMACLVLGMYLMGR